MSKCISGVNFPDNWPDLNCQLYLFLFGNKFAADPHWRPAGAIDPNPSPQPYTGEGRFEHALILLKFLFPKSWERHDWSLAQLRSFCENEQSAFSGCGGSGKSTTAAAYAIIWFLAAPADSAVLITSTTVEMAKKRIWKNIRQYYGELVQRFGGVGNTTLIGNPRPCIRSDQRDPRTGKMSADSAHGIYVVPVAKGEEQKGIDNLKGFHPSRLLGIADECDSIGQAVVDVSVNQRIGTTEYQAIWLGNDPSAFNPLGKLMEPEKGKSVGLEHKDWTSTTGIHCMRFDAFDSPNLRDKDKWKGIVRQQDIDASIKQFGENSPQIWIMLRGIHPPEGADNTVLSEALLLRYNCRDDVIWRNTTIESAALDPAFGGDRCVLRFFTRGNDAHGKLRLLFGQTVTIPIEANDPTNPAEYQIANRVKAECQKRGISPDEFSLDNTGTGRGVAAVLQREWSPKINICSFGGACSEMPVSEEDQKPASQAYDRRVTELWFSFREFVQADLIRGLDADTAVEFCQRQFTVKAKKTCIESKTEMKARGLPSPDFADAAVVYINMLREKGIQATISTPVKQEGDHRLRNFIREQDIDARSDTYSEDLAQDYAIY